MNNINRKLLTYSLFAIGFTGCGKKTDKEQISNNSYQSLKDVLTEDQLNENDIKKLADILANNPELYNTFLKLAYISEKELKKIHEKTNDQNTKQLMNFINTIKFAALLSELSKFTEEELSEIEGQINDISTHIENQESNDEDEENTNTEEINEEQDEDVNEDQSKETVNE